LDPADATLQQDILTEIKKVIAIHKLMSQLGDATYVPRTQQQKSTFL